VRPAAAVSTRSSAPALRPPLKWAGGKRWQVPHIRPCWEPHAARRLVEPFCGGLAVALALRPKRALLNDANRHLINFYRWLKSGLTPSVPMRNQEELFYRHRDRFNALIHADGCESAESAALFYYLNRTAYNGLCRFNGSGEFNVPFGQYRSISYAETKEFHAFRQAFATWNFTAGDFEQVALDDDDFVYADPPYDVEFTAYSQGGFSWDDQTRAAEFFSRHKGPTILVNQFTKRVDELYRKLGYAVTYLHAPRRISCTGDRTPAREIFATRNF
jgi:DNA adenine methylase